MSIFDFFKRKSRTPRPQIEPDPVKLKVSDRMTYGTQPAPSSPVTVKRFFHNERGFQCYTTWFSYWGGWISAGHCVTEANQHAPDFAAGDMISWPDGLDAALAGCTLPKTSPPSPVIGQDVILQGFPAGSRTMETRTGRVYYERGAGAWIAHIFEPDEPVVTGMSGGPVICVKTQQPIGIIITRNSPADLNNDRDPDESADFIALSEVWTALKSGGIA